MKNILFWLQRINVMGFCETLNKILGNSNGLQVHCSLGILVDYRFSTLCNMLTCKFIEINKRISADCSLFGLTVYLYHFKCVKLFLKVIKCVQLLQFVYIKRLWYNKFCNIPKV